MYSKMLQDAVLGIESIKEYYFSEVDNIEESIKKDCKKYHLGTIIDYYLYSKAVDKPLLLEGKIGEYIKNVGEDLIIDFKIDNSDENKVSITYKVKDREELEKKGYELNSQKAKREYTKINERLVLFNNSSLMMLVIKYEEAINRLFRYLINIYPSAYLNKKTICYSEINDIDIDIKTIKNYLVKNEVEEIMRLSVSDWYKLLEQNHKVTFNSFENYFNEFKEIYYRRNIIVHNNGIVNKTYLQYVDDSVKKDIKLGDEIHVNKEYLEKAFNLTFIIIYGTFIETLKPCTNKKNAMTVMFDLGFQHMLKNEWEVSKFIFYNLQRIRDQDACDIMLNKVNYWISIKNSIGIEGIKDEIEKFDVSALSGDFKMAKVTLLDKFDETRELLEKLLPNEITAESIENWPLFIQFRKSEEYENFKMKHKEYFDVYDYEHKINQTEGEEIPGDNDIMSNINNLDEKKCPNEEAAYFRE